MPSLENDHVTLSEILEVRGQPLQEEEVWGLLCQTLETIQDLFLRGKTNISGEPSYHVTPETILCTATGRVVLSSGFQDANNKSLQVSYITLGGDQYQHYQMAGVKVSLFSLGETLQYAINFRGGDVQLKSNLSSVLKATLQEMAQSNLSFRMGLSEILKVCSDHAVKFTGGLPFSHFVKRLHQEVLGSIPEKISRPKFVNRSSKPDVSMILRTESVKCETVVTSTVGIKVVLLNGELLSINCLSSVSGRQVFELVMQRMKLKHQYLFGLAFQKDGEFIFVDPSERLSKVAPPDWMDCTPEEQEFCPICQSFTLYLRVKFYLQDASLIRQQSTLHQYYLQLKRDILEERIPCSVHFAQKLAALALQAEFGDLNKSIFGYDYFLVEHYLPHSIILQMGKDNAKYRLCELHAQQTGISFEMAELLFVQEVQKLPSYGFHLHKVFQCKGNPSVNEWIGIGGMGIQAFKDVKWKFHKKWTFLWPEIAHISYTRRCFYLVSRLDSTTGHRRKYKFYVSEPVKAHYLFSMARSHHQFFAKLSCRGKASQLLNDGCHQRVTFHCRSCQNELMVVEVCLVKDDKLNFGISITCGTTPETILDGAFIESVVSGSPAEKAGSIEPGDLIVSVNGCNVEGWDYMDVVSLIQNSPISVKLGVVHLAQCNPACHACSRLLKVDECLKSRCPNFQSESRKSMKILDSSDILHSSHPDGLSIGSQQDEIVLKQQTLVPKPRYKWSDPNCTVMQTVQESAISVPVLKSQCPFSSLQVYGNPKPDNNFENCHRSLLGPLRFQNLNLMMELCWTKDFFTPRDSQNANMAPLFISGTSSVRNGLPEWVTGMGSSSFTGHNFGSDNVDNSVTTLDIACGSKQGQCATQENGSLGSIKMPTIYQHWSQWSACYPGPDYFDSEEARVPFEIAPHQQEAHQSTQEPKQLVAGLPFASYLTKEFIGLPRHTVFPSFSEETLYFIPTPVLVLNFNTTTWNGLNGEQVEDYRRHSILPGVLCEGPGINTGSSEWLSPLLALDFAIKERIPTDEVTSPSARFLLSSHVCSTTDEIADLFLRDCSQHTAPIEKHHLSVLQMGTGSEEDSVEPRACPPPVPPRRTHNQKKSKWRASRQAATPVGNIQQDEKTSTKCTTINRRFTELFNSMPHLHRKGIGHFLHKSSTPAEETTLIHPRRHSYPWGHKWTLFKSSHANAAPSTCKSQRQGSSQVTGILEKLFNSHMQTGYREQQYYEDSVPKPPPRRSSLMNKIEDIFQLINSENTFQVHLTKCSHGLGFSIYGGRDLGEKDPVRQLIRVRKLYPLHPAAESGQLMIGDIILSVNGKQLMGLAYAEALEALRTASQDVVLTVCRLPASSIPPLSSYVQDHSPCGSMLFPPVYDHVGIGKSCRISSHYLSDTQEFEVTLIKQSGSLGFTVARREELRDGKLVSGIYVTALVREPAKYDGRIQPGDRILTVNGTDVSCMSHTEAICFLRGAPDTVTLCLHRTGEPPQSPCSMEENPHVGKPLRKEAMKMLSDRAKHKGSSDVLRGLRDRKPLHQESNSDSDSSSSNDLPNVEQSEPADPSLSRKTHTEHVSLEVAAQSESLGLQRNMRPKSLDILNSFQRKQYPGAGGDSIGFFRQCSAIGTSEGTTIGKNLPTPDSIKGPKTLVKWRGMVLPRNQQSPGGGEDYVPHNLPPSPPFEDSHTFDSKLSCSTLSDDFDSDYPVPDTLIEFPHYPSQVPFYLESVEEDSKVMYIHVELDRGWHGRLGFSLCDAAALTNTIEPVSLPNCAVVKAVYPRSVAALDGRIKEGDRLVQVNEEDMEGKRAAEVIDLLRKTRGTIRMIFARLKNSITSSTDASSDLPGTESSLHPFT